MGHERLDLSGRPCFKKTPHLYEDSGYFSLQRDVCRRVFAENLAHHLLSNDTNDARLLIPQFGRKMQRKFSIPKLRHQIEEYSKRKLTRSSDSLNAIIGVLNWYTKSSANMKYPIQRLPWRLFTRKYGKSNAFGLLIFWERKTPPNRWPDFPSWSWTGWGGPLVFEIEEIILRPELTFEEGPLSYLDWQLSMRDVNGRISSMYDLALKEFEARKSKYPLYQPGPKQLQVSCLVVPVGFQEFDPTEDQKKYKTEI
jgi:hypothetical protein